MSKKPERVEVNDRVIRVRNSERGTFGRCPQQWWWNWRDGLKPKETAKPLWFGTAIHEALAHYYGPGRKRRKDFIDKFRESADMEAEYMRINIGGIDEDQYVEAQTLGETMLTEYVKRWGHDRDWDVIATEQTFSLRIPFYVPDVDSHPLLAEYLKGLPEYFILNGTFDGVYRDRSDKKIKLMEHKTAGTISVAHLPLDNQAGTYWMVAQSVGRDQGWLGSKEHIREITYNFLRKALPDPRPTDAEGYATNKPLKVHYLESLAELGIQHVEQSSPKSGPIAVEKATLKDLEAATSILGMRVVGDRSVRQPPPLFERHPVRKSVGQRKMHLRRLQEEVLTMTMVVDGMEPIRKTPDRGHCGFCSFREMCELHDSGAGWTEYRDAVYRVEDPYADHRKSAAA